jgi:hypothetical protein
MSKLNKYAQTSEGVIRRDFEVAAKSLKRMNEALIERVKASVDLIAELQTMNKDLVHALTIERTDHARTLDELLLLQNGKEGIEESSGNPEEGTGEVIAVSEAEEKKEEVTNG